MLKVITIDFWNTIFDSSNGAERNAFRQRALIEEIDKYGIAIKQDSFIEAVQASWAYFNDIWKNEQRTPEAFDTVSFFWNYLKLPENEESIVKVAKAFSDSNLYYPPSLLPGIESVLSKLSEKYKLAIVSDTGFSPGTVLKEMLAKENILKYFSAFSFSDETGVSKPHPNAFNSILNALDCNPSFALHIGDIEETDVVGAKNLGMKAIRFVGDPTSDFADRNPQKSIADAEAKEWSEIPILIDKLTNKMSI